MTLPVNKKGTSNFMQIKVSDIYFCLSRYLKITCKNIKFHIFPKRQKQSLK